MMARVLPVILFFALLCWPGATTAQLQWNIKMLGHWDDDSIPESWAGAFSECWGYAAQGREYAFIGSTQGTYFFDVTDASVPVQIGYFTTRDTATLVVNKDYATYGHYLYAVSDQGDNALQIFDLQYLPDSVSLVYESDALSRRCHTVFVERGRLYMCSNTRFDYSVGPMDIFSLADPLNPALLGTVWNPGFSFVHEVFVMNDTAYCANGNDGLWIYDVRNPVSPHLISILDDYPEAGYNHSAWLTADGKTMVFTDENRGKGVKIYDMADIYDPQLVSMVRSNLLQVDDPTGPFGSMAHNPYIVGNSLLVSWYHDGVAVFDISDPSRPVRTGLYDTHPQDTIYYGSKGCWGLYPFLPSGNIIASDIDNGLFILDGSKALMPAFDPSPPSIFVGPNPSSGNLEIHFERIEEHRIGISFFDYAGRLALRREVETAAGTGVIRIAVPELASGLYVVVLESGNTRQTGKIVIAKDERN
jgi:choice-of-anchor B domain-containing protein